MSARPVNPVVVETTRGGKVESVHRGAFCVADASGAVITASGDIDTPIYPRSAIKAFQALAVVESGAVDRFGFSDRHIAFMCSSHGGEPDHVKTARAMLSRLGLDEDAYECGAHWPSTFDATLDLARQCGQPSQAHNNCSGKHAGMLMLALHNAWPITGYTDPDHPVQRAVASVIADLCQVDIAGAPRAIDGCSVPTWALPLRRLAHGFARFADGADLSDKRAAACRRIIAAVAAHPYMVAGTGRFCTDVMAAVPRAFVKTGAEGVFCGLIPHAGIGVALKCDDGATRASEKAMAAVLASLDVWSHDEQARLAAFASETLYNRRHIAVGEVRATLP